MNYLDVKRGKTLFLGMQGDNGALTLRFQKHFVDYDLPAGGQYTLVFHNPVGGIYPRVIDTDEEYILWTVLNEDTQYEGEGEVEIRYAFGDDGAHHSELWNTVVARSIIENGETPAEYQSWVDFVAGKAEYIFGEADRAEAAADAAAGSAAAAAESEAAAAASENAAAGSESAAAGSAAEAASSASGAAGSASAAAGSAAQAETAATNAGTAASAAAGSAAQAGSSAGAAAGSAAAAAASAAHYPYVDETTGNWFVWNVTAGEWEDSGVHAQGAAGTDGEDGEDGVSPTVAVTDITGGHRVTITDAQGTRYFDVRNGTDGTDGQDGDDGVSPLVTVADIPNGHRITIMDATGDHTYDAPNGTDGQDGEDGVSVTDFSLVSGTHAPGTYDTYRMTLSNGETYDVVVYNGANGEGSGDMVAAVYDADSSVATAGGIAAYVEANGGKIDKIQKNGTDIPIVGKTVNISVPTSASDVGADPAGTASAAVAPINAKIPAQASSSNQLADKDFVNSSIENVAAYYITKDAAGNPFATKAELNAATVFYSGGAVRTPTRNDYCVVLADESKTITETGENPTTRYLYYNGWNYQYVVNRSGLTAAQWSAVNSGITAAAVTQIETNRQAITGKQDTISDLATIRSGAAAGAAAQPKITASGILKGNGSGGVSAAAAGTDYVATNDSRLSDARTPTAHTHGNVTNDGKIGGVALDNTLVKLVSGALQTLGGTAVSAGAKIETGSYVGTGTAEQANAINIAFGFVPKLFVISKKGYTATIESNSSSAYGMVINCVQLTSSFAALENSSSTYIYWKLAGNIISWYARTYPALMMNESGQSYYYIAIG